MTGTVFDKAALQAFTGALRTPYVFGCITLAMALVIALLIPKPSHFQLGVFAVLLGLSVAGITSGITGTIQVSTKWVKAGGPLGAFVFTVMVIIWVSEPSPNIAPDQKGGAVMSKPASRKSISKTPFAPIPNGHSNG